MPRFRPHEHLRRPADFQAVYDRRRSAADGTLVVYARENGLPHSRVGLSVSKKFGGAVVRNRIRRLLREAYRLGRDELPTGFDLVLIPRPQEAYTLDAFRRSLGKLVPQAVKKIARDAQAAKPAAERAMIGRAIAAVVIGLVRVYQKVLRPVLPPLCIYQPGCSEYMILAVRKYGPWRGVPKGLWRICRCHPFNPGGTTHRTPDGTHGTDGTYASHWSHVSHQMASGPRSPVRMRMQSSSGRMKIFPSPIRPSGPGRPAVTIAFTVGSTKSSFTAI